MRAYLRVKIKSLAAEAVIIKSEERRHRRVPLVRESLHLHRVRDVRREARAALLALAFLRDVPVARLEDRARTRPVWERVESLVRKYGDGDVRDRMQKFSEWRAQHPVSATP